MIKAIVRLADPDNRGPARHSLGDAFTSSTAQARGRSSRCGPDARKVGQRGAKRNGSVPGGTGIGPGALPLAEAYVRWAEEVETHLQVLTFDFDVLNALQTGRYRRIRQLHEEPVWPTQLVRLEIAQQTNWLESLRGDLQLRIDRVAAAPGGSNDS